MQPRFSWITLGVEGGLNEANLNCHLFAPLGSGDFVMVDAGTVFVGLQRCLAAGCFDGLAIRSDPGLSPAGTILHHHVKAQLITHPFLDHTAGLVLASPNDAARPIISLPAIIADIRNHIFNWRTWPNFGDCGPAPVLNQYHCMALEAGQAFQLPGCSLRVTAYALAHGQHTDSAAFLLELDGHYLLYMGDTGPDEVEGRGNTRELWRKIAPLIGERRLHAIFIETSYVDERPDDQLFSHLTPRWVMRAFHDLAAELGTAGPLAGLNVGIMHIKPDLLAAEAPRAVIRRQLIERNDLGLNLIFAEQARRYEL